MKAFIFSYCKLMAIVVAANLEAARKEMKETMVYPNSDKWKYVCSVEGVDGVKIFMNGEEQ